MVHLLFISLALFFFPPFCLPFSRFFSPSLSSTPHFASLTPGSSELGCGGDAEVVNERSHTLLDWAEVH